MAAWLTRYAIGAVRAFEPIAAGIENTNYFVTSDKGRYVLTLYERLPAEELPFYLNLMAHLAHAGVQVPAPEPDRSGALWSMLNGKPAGLVTRLNGAAVVQPTPRIARPRERRWRECTCRSHAIADGLPIDVDPVGGARLRARCARSCRPSRTR